VDSFSRPRAGDIRGQDLRFLLGVTGGIASGKTTVAGMIAELGAKTIDFDLLSRRVVEPGKRAWEEIVAFFGGQVLREDRTLDRKKISEIVFRDPEKRRKLEGFTHPRIYAEFAARTQELAREDPQAIIQAVVPLLFEANLRPLFHKVLVVYVPEEIQMQRLMDRDRIPLETARSILAAQLPIGEKKGLADYLVDNSGSPAETKKQVLRIWEEIRELQKSRSG
jgi:dephospho-CoA kinase